MVNYKFYVATFFAIILACASVGCSNSYTKAKTVTSVSAYPAAIQKALKAHRYFLMKSGINLYTVTSVDLDQAKQQMTVTLDKVDSTRLIAASKPLNSPYKPQKGERASSSQIHLYMTDSTSYTLDEPHTIPLVKVGRVELVD